MLAPTMIWDDALARTPDDEVYVDFYMWTPPCQDFSSAGKRKGIEGNRDVGKLIKRSLAHTKEKRPRLAIFENVPSLLSKHFRAVFMGIKSTLQNTIWTTSCTPAR